MTTRIQFDVSDDGLKDINNMMSITGASTKKELLNNALTLFEWAINEKKDAFIICSLDKESGNFRELIMPLLNNVGGKRP